MHNSFCYENEKPLHFILYHGSGDNRGHKALAGIGGTAVIIRHLG